MTKLMWEMMGEPISKGEQETKKGDVKRMTRRIVGGGKDTLRYPSFWS